jgi:hypothetical protein
VLFLGHSGWRVLKTGRINVCSLSLSFFHIKCYIIYEVLWESLRDVRKLSLVVLVTLPFYSLYCPYTRGPLSSINAAAGIAWFHHVYFCRVTALHCSHSTITETTHRLWNVSCICLDGRFIPNFSLSIIHSCHHLHHHSLIWQTKLCDSICVASLIW